MSEKNEVAASHAGKRGRDATRTVRQVAHLERLEAAQGKRLVVDLDAAAREALGRLIDVGYGTSQAGVVRRALMEVAADFRKRTPKSQ